MVRQLQAPKSVGIIDTPDLELLAERLNSGRPVNQFVMDRFWPFSESVDPDVADILEPFAESIVSQHPSVVKIGFHTTKETVLPFGLPDGPFGWNLGKRRYYEAASTLAPQYLLGRLARSRIIVAAARTDIRPSGRFYTAPEDRIDRLMNEELAELDLTVHDMDPNVLYELGPRTLYRRSQSRSSEPTEKTTLAISTYTSVYA